MNQFGWPDCPADVKRQIEFLIDALRKRLSGNLVGIYLHGSLAAGCFNPSRSDIDLLVVTRRRMGDAVERALVRLFIGNSGKPAPVEISFVTLDDLHPWRHPTPFDFHFSEDWREDFERRLENEGGKTWDAGERVDGDLATHITVLRRRGRRLDGAPVEEVFPVVPERDFVDSILGDVLSPRYGLDAIGDWPVYVVLNACRTLAFLRSKVVLSKEEGGRWALDNLPFEFHRTIRAALAEYAGGRNDRTNLPKEGLAAFAAFMKEEIERAARR